MAEYQYELLRCAYMGEYEGNYERKASKTRGEDKEQTHFGSIFN